MFPILNKLLALGLALLFFGGCGSHYYHVVKPGETLYSLGWWYGQDYRQIATWNGIKPPYIISPGQRLQIAPLPDQAVGERSDQASVMSSSGTQSEKGETSPSFHKKNAVKTGKRLDDKEDGTLIDWQWPVQGRLTQPFNGAQGKKGIDIQGEDGQLIYAAGNGEVVYSGNGLLGYGQLVIVKHNDLYLSAYGHNRELLVREGERVNRGQKIAKMGRSNGSNQALLHFEIRENGKPVDPLRYLPKQQP